MRLGVCAALLCLSVVGLSYGADAQASIRKAISIPAQGLGPALNMFAKDRDLQVVYRSEIVGSLRTQGVSGDWTVDEALKQLLSGTGLTYRYIDDRTVTILPAGSALSQEQFTAPAVTGDDPNRASAAAKEGKKDSSHEFRLAQVDQGANSRSSTVVSNQDSQKKMQLTEIIVTAQKREERLIDVPMSVVAVGADELQQRQLTSLEDIASAVPDLSYVRTAGNYGFEIRGISASASSTPSVGVYIDDADVTLGGQVGTQINPVAYDLERVEVLRGPQGTLYGDGSMGGTIRFITRNPNLGSFTFDSDVAASFTENGDPSQRINFSLNIPVIEDQLGLRVTGTQQHDGGWIDQPAADQKHINGQDLTNLRVKGLWQPDPALTIKATAIINRDQRGFDYSDPGSAYRFTQVFNLTNTPRMRNDYDLYNLTTTYDLSSAAQILNTTSYLRVSVPVSNVENSVQYYAPPSPPFDTYIPFDTTVDHLLTDELRLTSIGSGRWQWTLGGFFRYYRDYNSVPLVYFGTPIPPGTPLSSLQVPGADSANLFKSWAVFGDTNYRLWDRVTVGAGARYFIERQDLFDFIGMTQQAGRFHSADPRFYAQWKVTADLNVYTSAAKGFRSGGFNLPGQPTFGPEHVWTYELGTKLALLEGRVGFDTAVFWSDYADFSTFGNLPGSPSFITSNAGKARIKGIEADLSWRPFDQWHLDLRGDYLSDKFTEIDATSTAFVAGDSLDFVPRYQFTLSGQRDFLWHGRQGFMRLDYSQQGPEEFRNRSIGPWFYAESDVIRLLNFHANLRLNDNLSLGIFSQNLLNDTGFVSPTYIDGDGTRSRPRTFGVDFSTTFH